MFLSRPILSMWADLRTLNDTHPRVWYQLVQHTESYSPNRVINFSIKWLPLTLLWLCCPFGAGEAIGNDTQWLSREDQCLRDASGQFQVDDGRNRERTHARSMTDLCEDKWVSGWPARLTLIAQISLDLGETHALTYGRWVPKSTNQGQHFEATIPKADYSTRHQDNSHLTNEETKSQGQLERWLHYISSNSYSLMAIKQYFQ